MSINLLSDYAAYNYWANERINSMVEKTGEENVNKNIESSFSSIHKTLLHILDAQYLWLHRMQHDHFPEAPSISFNGNLVELMERLRTSSQNLKQFVSEMQTDDFKKTLTYKNSKGVEYTSPFSETILHCINHSTFHRGQIITMLRQLGENELIGTDYYVYCRFK